MKLPTALVRILNIFLVPLLRSPLHGLMSANIMVITVVGRRSGRRYVFPVSYLERDGELLCFTNNNWWRNVVEGGPVELVLRGNARTGRTSLASRDEESVREGLRALFDKIPSDAPYYDVRLGSDGTPDRAQLAAAAQATVLIRITAVA